MRLVENDVFKHNTAKYMLIETVNVLYNDAYCGFQFSDAFIAELERRLNSAGACRVSAIHGHYRANPIAIQLYREKGREWSSVPGLSDIRCVHIPKLLEHHWIVDDDDGHETIIVNFSYAIECAVNEYLKNPTPERLELFKYEIANIQSSRDNWNNIYGYNRHSV